MKRYLAAILVLMLVCSLAAACAKKEAEKPATPPPPPPPEFKVGMVTDIGGLGDQSFNDAAYRGLKAAESKLGAKIAVVESKKMDDYVPNLRSLAEQKFDLTWAIGFLMTDATKTVAPQFSALKFGIIDSVVDAPNVASCTFKEEEGSYLIGVIAAMMTKKNVIGFIGGMDVPIIEKFEAGFLAGVRTVNPKAKVFIGYTGKFDDPPKGKELAITQYKQGADIIYHASGACGIGVFEAAKEKGAGFWAMGVDSCQHHLAPDNCLGCMLKGVDTAVFDVAKRLKEKAFEGKHYIYGLKENGVGVCELGLKALSPEVAKKVEELSKLIVEGKLVIPSTDAELKAFQPPK